MKRAADALDECGALPWADLRPGDVPPDVRQRAAVARAVARRPRLLLLEDPVYTVPPDGARELLAACRRAARTVVAATHRRDSLVLEFADTAARWDAFGFLADDETQEARKAREARDASGTTGETYMGSG
jgi:energy-coupling factor transporter ATP-binding protein EcfA2